MTGGRAGVGGGRTRLRRPGRLTIERMREGGGRPWARAGFAAERLAAAPWPSERSKARGLTFTEAGVGGDDNNDGRAMGIELTSSSDTEMAAILLRLAVGREDNGKYSSRMGCSTGLRCCWAAGGGEPCCTSGPRTTAACPGPDAVRRVCSIRCGNDGVWLHLLEAVDASAAASAVQGTGPRTERQGVRRAAGGAEGGDAVRRAASLSAAGFAFRAPPRRVRHEPR